MPEGSSFPAPNYGTDPEVRMHRLTFGLIREIDYIFYELNNRVVYIPEDDNPDEHILSIGLDIFESPITITRFEQKVHTDSQLQAEIYVVTERHPNQPGKVLRYSIFSNGIGAYSTRLTYFSEDPLTGSLTNMVRASGESVVGGFIPNPHQTSKHVHANLRKEIYYDAPEEAIDGLTRSLKKVYKK